MGISRPVLYKEFANKHHLAEVIVQQEVDIFLIGSTETMAAHPYDVTAGLNAAVDHTLRAGADDILLRAIPAGRSAPATVLLSVLMTQPGPVSGRTATAVHAAVRAQYELPTLSHLFQPTGSIERAVRQIERVIVSTFGDALR